MNFKEQLVEHLNEHLRIEIEAKNFYGVLVNKINDERIKNKINIILNQEINHIKLTQECVDAIKTHEFKIGEKPVVEEDREKIKKILENFLEISPLLMVNTTANQTERILLLMRIMTRAGWYCLYVTFNRPSKLWKEQFEKNDISIKNIEFLDSVVGLEENKSVSPHDLTRITIALNETMQKKSEKLFVVVDSISTLTLYHNENTIQRFVQFIISKTSEKGVGCVVLVVEGVAEKSLVESLKLLFQKVFQ